MKKTSVLLFAVVLGSGLLTGCASIVNGTSQKVSVTTPPTTNAQCDLSNSKGNWHVRSTPATIKVHRAFGALTAVCSKAGYRKSTKKFESNTKKMLLGNAVFGGVIGAGIDTANGSAYSYPETLVIPMKKRR